MIGNKFYTWFKNYYQWVGGAFNETLLLPLVRAVDGLRAGAVRYDETRDVVEKYDGTSWSDVAVPYTGANDDVDLGEYGIDAGYVALDTTPTNTPTDQGTIYWDDAAETAAIIMNGTIQKVGEDLFFQVKNQSGSLIAKGTCVKFAGTDGNSGKLLIEPFIANGTVQSQYFMGITAEDIDNGANGKVYHFGKMRGVNTSAYQDGDILYASTTVAGGFQTVAPTAPNNIIVVAAVINAANNGTLMIRPTINDDNTIYNVDGTLTGARALTLGGNPLDIVGSTTTRFFANGRLGIGTTTDAGYTADINGSLAVRDHVLIQQNSTNRNVLITSTTNPISFSGSSRQNVIIGEHNITRSFSNTDNVLIGALSGQNVTSGGGNILIGRSALSSVATGGFNVAIGYIAGNPSSSGGQHTAIGDVSNKLILGNHTGTPIFGDMSTRQVIINGSNTNIPTINSSVQFGIESTTRGFLPPAMTAAQVSAISTPATGLMAYDTTNNELDVYNGSSWQALQYKLTNPVTGTGASGQVSYWTGTGTQAGSNNLFWDNANGRLGIQSNELYSALQLGTPQVHNSVTQYYTSDFTIYGTSPAAFSASTGGGTSTKFANLVLTSISDPAVGVGSAIAFGGRNQQTALSNAQSLFAAIRGAKESTGNGTQGYLAFFTSGSDGNERMRISSSGAITFNAVLSGAQRYAFWLNNTIGSAAGQGASGLYNSQVITASGNNETLSLVDINGSFSLSTFTGVRQIGLRSRISSGAERWNLYIDGTANNYLAGNLLLNTTTDAGFRFDCNGTARVQSTLKVGAATSQAASAVLDVESTTRGFLPPRMTTAQRDAIASPAAGLVIFNTTTTKLECYDGTTWQAAW